MNIQARVWMMQHSELGTGGPLISDGCLVNCGQMFNAVIFSHFWMKPSGMGTQVPHLPVDQESWCFRGWQKTSAGIPLEPWKRQTPQGWSLDTPRSSPRLCKREEKKTETMQGKPMAQMYSLVLTRGKCQSFREKGN